MGLYPRAPEAPGARARRLTGRPRPQAHAVTGREARQAHEVARVGGAYGSLDFTDTFLESFASRDFTASDRKAFLKALKLLDENEKHSSLRVHKLEGDREGSWVASASGALRLTFERLEGGRKRLLTCSKHYDR